MNGRKLKLLYIPEYSYSQKLQEAKEGRGPQLPYMYFIENATKFGIQADVLSGRSTGPFGVWIPGKLKGLWLGLRALRVLSQYDIVLSWYGPSAMILAARMVLRWKRPRIAVLAWRPFNTQTHGVLRFLKRVRTRLLLSRADKIMVISTLQTKQFSRELGLNEDRFEFIPYAIDCEFFDPGGIRVCCLDSARDPILAMTGNANRDDTLMLKTIAGEKLQLKRITTFPQIAQYVLEHAEREGIGNVDMLHDIPYQQMKRVLAESNVVTLPITNADHPAGLTSLLEAMAMAKPIVATRGLATKDYVEDGKTAILVGSDDVAAWKAAILGLLEDQDRLDQLGRSARARAIEEFSLPVVAKRMATIIKELVS